MLQQIDRNLRKGAPFPGRDLLLFSLASMGIKPSSEQKTTLNTPAKAMNYAYIAALSIIALLTIGSHFLTAHIITKQQESAELAYNIGRQRTLIRDVVTHAAQYYAQGLQVDADFLNTSLNEMEDGQKFMISTINSDAGLHAALSEIYFGQPYDLNKRILNFIAAGRTFIKFPSDDHSDGRRNAVGELSDKNATPLVRNLDIALENYQTEARAQTERYSALQFYAAMSVLVVLLLEALLIFRPLVHRVNEYHHMLLRYALEDYLTGLNNRRAFMKRAVAELRRAEREAVQTTVVLTDLDKFKHVNDTYGHRVGDLVLQHFSSLMQSGLRTADIIGRIGGEEFAIVLPRTDLDKAYLTIDRLREKVAQTPCPYVDDQGKEQILSYTASFGMVVIDNGRKSIDELLARADAGLYEAKSRGRNCVVQVPAEPDKGTESAG